jgi:hypothetical protein
MGNHGDVGFLLDSDHQIMGAMTGGTPGPVGDADIGGGKGHEIGDGGEKTVSPRISGCIRLGRKKFKAERGFLLGEKIFDKHGNP